jgi:hypothetical protein
MSNHRNPRPSLSRPFPDKFDPTASRERAACSEADIEAIRYEVARADVLADAAMQAFDITVWREVDDARIDHVSHLVSAASEAASAALLAVDDLRRAMARRTVTAETNAVDEFQGFACRQACAAVLNARRSGRPMPGQLTVDRSTLENLLDHAASAAHIVGHLDGAIATGPLGDHVDAIVHELTELLGDPHTLVAPVQGARSTLALDVTPDAAPEHVEPDASAASRTISIAIVPYRAAGGAS